MALNAPLNRKLRMGLVGGGRGAFIGRVHAVAALLDNRTALVAGALSSQPDKARSSAADYEIPPERAYGSYQEMVTAEAQRPADQRLDFVSIATPNHTHFEIARAFASAGFHVLCDKPLTTDLRQAEELAEVVRQAGVLFAVTHNYTGYPLVRQARGMVRGRELGDIQAIRVCYLQGSLRRQRTPEQQQRFAWKTDPARAGPSACFGDIGIHAYNLVRFITGLLPEEISCQLCTFEPGGRLDDYGSAVLRFQNGALATITASRISHGRANDLRIEIDGTKGALAWRQEEPCCLWLRSNGEPSRLYTRDPNGLYLSVTAKAACRLPSGYPEGFLEAFANIYTAAYAEIIACATGQQVDRAKSLYPTIADGVDGVNFIAQCVASSQQQGAWRSLRHPLCRA